ncbi:MAG: BBP7 family outer membrane beta-barrel protein [Planctomycetes bacterium]|nr:BBP7 family outer membrane beta-barrel protein [Planctomycetota bacterium]
MRTTVLTFTLLATLLGSTSHLRADDNQWKFAGQSPEVWEESGSFADSPYPEGSEESPSYIRPRYWFLPPKFGVYAEIDALFLGRFGGGANNQAIATNNPVDSQVVMTVGNASLAGQYNPGLVGTLGFNLDQIAQLEITYWGLNSWNNSATVTDNGPFPSLGLAGTLQTVTSDYQLADRITIDYTSYIQNAEINYKQTINGVTLMFGPRYLRMVEGFNIQSQSGYTLTTSDYHITAVNNLIGLQFGAGWRFERGPWYFSLTGKAGPYMNAVHQSTLMQDFGNTITLRNYNADGMPISTLVETESKLMYRVTDWFALSVGHRFLWIQNLAFAPDQLDLSNSPPGTQVLNAHNHLWLSGFTVGGEFRW